MSLIDDYLVVRRDNSASIGGDQIIYRLPNGYGLSCINSPAVHAFPFAWEIAVLSPGTKDGTFSGLDCTTPLTSGVEVFDTDDEANDFIRHAIAWARADANGEQPGTGVWADRYAANAIERLARELDSIRNACTGSGKGDAAR